MLNTKVLLIDFQIAYDDGVSRQACYIFIAIAHLITLVSTFGWLPKMYIEDTDIASNILALISDIGNILLIEL